MTKTVDQNTIFWNVYNRIQQNSSNQYKDTCKTELNNAALNIII